MNTLVSTSKWTSKWVYNERISKSYSHTLSATLRRFSHGNTASMFS